MKISKIIDKVKSMGDTASCTIMHYDNYASTEYILDGKSITKRYTDIDVDVDLGEEYIHIQKGYYCYYINKKSMIKCSYINYYDRRKENEL